MASRVNVCGMKFKFGFSFRRYKIEIVLCNQTMNPQLILAELSISTNEKDDNGDNNNKMRNILKGEKRKKNIERNVSSLLMNDIRPFYTRILQKKHNPFDLLLKLPP